MFAESPAEKVAPSSSKGTSAASADQVELFDILYSFTADMVADIIWQETEGGDSDAPVLTCATESPSIMSVSRHIGERLTAAMVELNQGAGTATTSPHADTFAAADTVAARLSGHFGLDTYFDIIVPLAMRLLIENYDAATIAPAEDEPPMRDMGPAAISVLLLDQRSEFMNLAATLIGCTCADRDCHSVDIPTYTTDLRPAVHEADTARVIYRAAQ